MKYNYKEGVVKQTSHKWAVFSVVGIFSGAYLLVNALSPVLLDAMTPPDTTAKKLVSLQPDSSADKIYLPKINTEVDLLGAESGGGSSLEAGALQRSDAGSNPHDGGNFVVEASRFSLGLTPQQTKAKSPFYHINKLTNGDDIYVDYKGVRYAYKVTDRQLVGEEDSSITAPSDDAQLTLYAASGTSREVITAKPVGKIVWQGGKPLLKSL